MLDAASGCATGKKPWLYPVHSLSASAAVTPGTGQDGLRSDPVTAVLAFSYYSEFPKRGVLAICRFQLFAFFLLGQARVCCLLG